MMRGIWIVLSTLGASAACHAGGVTLENAFDAAVQRTEQIPIAQSRLRQSQAQALNYRGDLLPSLSLGASYQRQASVFSTTGEYDQALAKLTLKQSLYAGGKDRANLQAAAALVRAAEFDVVDSRNDLYVQVAQAFYELLSATQEVVNTKKSIELTGKRIVELQRRKKIGKSRNIEILAAESQRSVLESQLVAAQAALRTARNSFSNITGLDGESELNGDIDVPVLTENLRVLLEKVESRADISSKRASVESSDNLVRAARAEHLPTLDLGANYYFSRYHFQATAPDWDLGLTLTFPLYSGGKTVAAVREAQESKIQAELELRQAKRSAEAEIRNAYTSLAGSLDQLKALEKAARATEQNYREQEKDYRYSLATNLEVLQALSSYYETKLTLDRTKYQALKAAAELKAATNDL